MSDPSARSLYWLRYPNIPIYLDTGDKPPGQKSTSGHICPTCKTSSEDQPIHCITTSSSPVPPPYSSNPPSTALSTTKLSPPSLNVQTSSRLFRPLPPQPALRYDLAERSRVRFRRTTLSPLSPHVVNEDVDFNQKSHVGLGIPEAPFYPDISPIKSPAIEAMEKAETSENSKNITKSPNLAQRIEEKLWKYSASGNVVKRWLLEMISWLLSAICMGAIIGVLIFLNNRPTPDWPFGLRLHTYISVLSKVASASLLLPVSEALGQLKWLWFQSDSKKMWDFEIFDNASRGPWGSLLLLVRTKGTTLAALGATVTLFAMALDPFFQQVVDYPSGMALNTTLNGIIPRVLQYRPDYDRETRTGIEIALPEQDMQTVFLKYLYGNGTEQLPVSMDARPEIPLSCPTSNCTWPEYDTLAICSACEDVSELLTYECLSGELDWTATGVLSESGRIANGTMCGWFVNATDADAKSQPILMSGYHESSPELPNEEVLLTRVLPLITNPMRKQLYGNGSYRFKHIQNPLLDFFVVSAANGVDSVYRRERPVAQECMLSWCVKTLKCSYFEGVYEERVTNVFMNTTATKYPWRAERLETQFENGTVLNYVQDVHLEHNGEVFGTSNTTVARATYAYDDYFPSVFTQTNGSDAPLLRYKIQKTADKSPFLRNISFNPFLAPNNVTNHMDRLAKALTTMMRSSDEREWVYGDVYSQETLVHVQWVWLSLPLGLLFFTLIFLSGTIIKSSLAKEHVGAWKTSAIATLLYGLPDDMQKKITAPAPGDTTHTPRAKAKKLKVKMLPKMGWRISGNQLPYLTPKAWQSQSPKGSS